MEIERLSETSDILNNAISDFPVGAKTLADLKSIEEKIEDIRVALKVIDAKRLTLNAIIEAEKITDLSEEELNKSFKKLNISTTNYLINAKTLKLCNQTKAIQDILYRSASPKIEEKVKACLSKLFKANDEMASKNEKKKELMKKQYQLKLECHRAIYDYQNFLKEKEAKRNQQLQETNPDFIHFKEKINRSIFKINTMKKLITNLIAPMHRELMMREDLLEMLAKHKDIINLDTIIELTQNQNSTNR